ncbi:DUF6082 family protein [Actinoplanes sp. CA-054009]
MNAKRATAGSKHLLIALTVATIACLVAAIAAAPWLMNLLASRPTDWGDLADLGQAYGGVAAVLSTLALCGIAASLVLQWRQATLADTATRRAQHLELVKLALNDPDLCFPLAPGVSRSEMRRWMILNLWTSHWVMLWDTRMLERTELRRLFDELFRDPAALTWWPSMGSKEWAGTRTRHRATFHEVAEEAYREAVDAAGRHSDHGGHVEPSPPALPEPDARTRPGGRRGR